MISSWLMEGGQKHIAMTLCIISANFPLMVLRGLRWAYQEAANRGALTEAGGLRTPQLKSVFCHTKGSRALLATIRLTIATGFI
jgi:hypothetical protein